MSDLPQVTANNIDEFNEQARSFVAKAKSNGASNTAIANTITLMYGLYTQKRTEEQPDENWQYRDKDGDGIDDVMYNANTGEERPIDYGYGNDAFAELENSYSNTPNIKPPTTKLTAPGMSGYDAGRSTNTGEQIWSTSELDRLANNGDYSKPMSINQDYVQSVIPTPVPAPAPAPEMTTENNNMSINPYMTPNPYMNKPVPELPPTP